MGNNIVYEIDEDDFDDEDVDDMLGEQLSLAVGTVMSQLERLERLNPLERPTARMPVIRKKPDLRNFRHTMLYKEIKALCALPANSNRPSDRWSLTRGLFKRENGIAAHPAGSFTPNQQRRIANLFVPNNKDQRLMSLEAKVFICKFNKDGSKLITACQDSVIRVFDSSKGTYHRINRIVTDICNWSILDVDFSPCGQYLAYSTWSDAFFVLPVSSNGKDVQSFNLNAEQSRAGIFSLRFSPCGQHIIGGSNNSLIYVVDRETHAVRMINTQRTHKDDINAVSFVSDQDSNIFVSGCNNGVLKLWDLRCAGSTARGRSGSGSSYNNNRNSCTSVRHMPVGIFKGHLDGITYIDPRNDGHYLLTNSKDQSIKIWDVRMTSPNNKLNKVILPLIPWDYRWDTVPREYYNPKATLEGDVSVMTYRGHRVTKSLLRAKFSPALQTGQRYIYTGCGTGRIIIYDVLTGQIKEAIEGHKDIVRDLSWHPVRSEIVSGSWDSHVNLNTFKHNPLLKRPSSGSGYQGSLRRSLRIAHQNGDLDDEADEDEPEQSW
ncbi:PREDICTED: DDB1- and CUL4-associated factor 11 [Bactrocera latifrons]|uniref:DDB1-and CUL4-associated factor 11 n=1 Tax=Bactrocera latifrons TaxID=174628 RepID=A0A0K8WF54_BACLA|nr:PREDICTED: DDB1- and CUL4-associated factor 11 [Bactrocera latifrons]